MSGIFLAVETGGTKIVARLCGDGVDCAARWPTSTPAQAVSDVLAFVRDALGAERRVDALGMAAFGPILLEGEEAGTLLETPKPHWTGANVARDLADTLTCPFAVETDVNAAAIAEHALEPDCSSLAYVTIGTGIGGGLSRAGATLQGAMHPEIGHLPLLRAKHDETPSACPFHDHCAEGLVAGPALGRRLDGALLHEAPDVLALAADYAAQLVASVVLAWSPHKVVLGGGVGSAPGIIEGVRTRLPAVFGGYGVGDAVRQPDFLIPPKLDDAGLEGAMLLARRLLPDPA